LKTNGTLRRIEENSSEYYGGILRVSPNFILISLPVYIFRIELTKRAGDFFHFKDPPRPRDFCHTRKRVRQSAAPLVMDRSVIAWRSAQRSSLGATAAPLLNGPAMAKLGSTRTFLVIHRLHLERNLQNFAHTIRFSQYVATLNAGESPSLANCPKKTVDGGSVKSSPFVRYLA